MAAKTKYGKCIHSKDLIRSIAHYTGSSLLAHDGELDADCSIGYHCISKPMSFDFAHAHKFPEMLCFIGGRAEDITDFGAEIEFTLGGEKHHINTPAVVSIPAGVKHCPIVFKKVTKPLVFLEISLTRIWEPGRRRPPQKKNAKPAKKLTAKALKKVSAAKRSK
jgi:mannose-6-phosphate isomerase-like protein (cupin superfamily)